ncbi:MAG: hypothetical protein ABIH03_04620 [Pseudomonadota bacterium]
METNKIPDATLPPELRAMQAGLEAVNQALHPAIPGSPALADEVTAAHREALRQEQPSPKWEIEPPVKAERSLRLSDHFVITCHGPEEGYGYWLYGSVSLGKHIEFATPEEAMAAAPEFVLGLLEAELQELRDYCRRAKEDR